MKKKSSYLIFIISIICLLLSIFLFLYREKDASVVGVGDSGGNKEVVEKEDAIYIPGYEALSLVANSTSQSISLNNPTENDCYFVISLYLEDKTLLWKSDYISPGNNSEPLELTQELKEGTYSAILKYSCFSFDQKNRH